jgi:hypothetical protein
VKAKDEDDTVYVSPHMARRYEALEDWKGHWVRIVAGRLIHSGSMCRKCNGGRS